MKTELLIIALSVIFSAKAQDVIILGNGDELTGKITEVGISEIKYKKSETSPVYVIGKDKVFMIKYEDGTKDVFNQSKEKIKEKSTPESLQDVCQKGKNDASLNYEANRHAGCVGVATVLFSPIGLLIAISTSSVPPEDAELQAPNIKLLSNSNYKACYKNEAHRMKRRKIWSAFGTGLAVNLVVGVIIFSTFNSF